MLRNFGFVGLSCVVCFIGFVSASAAAVQWPVSAGGNDHWYEVVMDNQSSWTQSEAAAEQTGGYLATITSPGEQQFLESLLHNYASSSGAYWVGFKETNTEGVYAWVTGEPVSYTHWNPGEPNNAVGYDAPPEDSVQILWATDADANSWYLGRRGFWNDLPDSGLDVYLNPTGNIDLIRAGYVVETVPEPSTFALLGMGAFGLIGFAWRRFCA
jgi:hypothetical protein